MVTVQRTLPLSSFLLLLLGQLPTLGQVVPDASLGAEASQLQLQGNQTTIDGGANRGAALFHSFDQFNVADGQQVYFANLQGIEAILSRVTGTAASNLDGTLGVLGTADLFLLNPNGVVFGPNAQLDLPGSFTASTADSVQVGDVSFSATAPAPVPLLDINVLPGIQFGANAPDRFIQNQANLTLAPQQQLRFDGGTIDQAGQITIPGGTVDLRGQTLNLTGEINTRTADGLGVLRLSSPTDLTIAAAAPLTNQAIAQALQNNAVVVESDRNLTLIGTLTSNSPAPFTLISGNDLSLLPNNGDGIVRLAGNTTLQSGNNLLIENQLFVSNLDFLGASGNGVVQPTGTPPLQSGDIILVEGQLFAVNNQNPLQMRLQAEGDILIRDTPATTRNLPFTRDVTMIQLEGRDGLLSVQANNLTMQSNGFIVDAVGAPLIVMAATGITGQRGGDINIVLTGDLTLERNSGIFAQAFAGHSTGDLSIQSGQSVAVKQGSSIQTFLFSSDPFAQTGNIDIRADNTILLESGLVSTKSFGDAEVGDISLTAPQVILDESADTSLRPTFISTGTLFLSPNNAGNITINATESLELIGNQPDSAIIPNPQQLGFDDVLMQALDINNTVIEATSTGFGESGKIEINTGQLSLQNGAVIANANGIAGFPTRAENIVINANDILLRDFATIGNGTLGPGDGGRLEINSDRIRLEDGGFIGVSSLLGTGAAGDLVIRTDDLVVTGGSAIAANSERGGSGGLLDIQAQSTTIEGTSADGSFSSSLLTDTAATSSGPGGPLSIKTGTLEVLNGGQIRSSTRGPQNAGDITILADNITLNGTSSSNISSTLEAQSTGLGEAGNIQLTADRLTIRDSAALSTQSLQGNGGNIGLAIDEVLLLRQQGTLSATAGVDGTAGDGGNISIDAGFIVAPALENSDITANAFLGNGGNIAVRTNALLGIDFRDALTPLSDITASSEAGLDGTVVIEQVVDEVESDSIDLPENLVSDSDRLTAGCLLDENANFVATGRGGIPAGPGEQLNQALIWSDPRAASEVGETRSLESSRVMEAQGWQVNEQGEVELVAATGSTPPGVLSCQQLKQAMVDS